MAVYPDIWKGIEKPAPRYLLRLSMVEGLLNDLPHTTQTILEVGSGRGDVAGYLQRSRPSLRLTLCESSEVAVDHLRNRFSGSEKVEIVDKLQEITQNSFDVVIVFEVLEHIKDDFGFLQQLLVLLRPGGTLIMSVPAYMKKWQHQDEWAGHIRRYEYRELLDLLSSVRVECSTLYDYGFPFMSLVRPLKFLYYRSAAQSTKKLSDSEKTAASGMDRSSVLSLISSLVKPALFTFSKIQFLFRNRRLGDGFIFVGTLRD